MPSRIPWLLFLCCCYLVCPAQPRPALIPFTDGVKWGYADTTGKIAITPQWPEARFFRDRQAVVVVRKGSGNAQNNRYALIDEQGHYIIPPETGWNGQWGGNWGTTNLNAMDSNGLAGMTDLHGNMLLPYRWAAGANMLPPLSYSFKIVYQDGLAGIINRRGDLVVPPKWAQITSSGELSRIGAYLVTDPDNVGGSNSNGIADVENHLIIPARYSDIRLFKLQNGNLAFWVSINSNNERGNSYFSNDNTVSVRYLGYPQGQRVAPSPADLKQLEAYEYHLPGGYIAFSNGQALMDSNRKVLVPCCRFWKLTGDTILLRDEKQVGKDSAESIIRFLDVRTRQPLGPPFKQILYREAPRPYSGNVFREGHEGYERREPLRIPIPYYGEVEQFYKDSFLYRVSGYADTRHTCFIIAGEQREGTQRGRSGYYAVVDSNLDYVIPPQRNYRIISYNSREQLAVVNGYNEQYSSMQGYTVLAKGGIELMRPQKSEILAAFYWKGRVYTYIKVQDECNPEPSGAHIFLTDASGTPLPAFSALNVASYMHLASGQNMRQESFWGRNAANNMNVAPVTHTPQGSIWALDSAGHIGILFPDGQPVYPKLNFKYKGLAPAYNDWFLATESDRNTQILVDAENNQILRTLPILTLEPATMPIDPYGANAYELTSVPRLFSVVSKDRNGQELRFFLDDKGIAYISAP